MGASESFAAFLKEQLTPLGVIRSFWRVPERLVDEPDELVTWARAAARRVAAQRHRPARRRALPRGDRRDNECR